MLNPGILRIFALAILVFLGASTQVTSIAYAAETPEKLSSDIQVFGTDSNNITLPKYLFHWTTPESLANMAYFYEKDGKFPLKKVPGNHYLHFNSDYIWKKNKVLFAWSHPWGAMAFSPDEVYAK